MFTTAGIASSSSVAEKDHFESPAAGSPPHGRPAAADFARERIYTIAGLAITVIGAVMLGFDVGPVLVHRIRAGRGWGVLEQAAFIAIVYFFIYGNFVYLLARLGYLSRRLAHREPGRDELEAPFDSDEPPSLTVLVPSYREEKRVVTQTLLSAALMEYPRRRIVLLIDDPPNPDNPAAARQLEETRKIPAEMGRMLRDAARPFQAALADFEARRTRGKVLARTESRRLSILCRQAAQWFEAYAESWVGGDHTDRLFANKILLEPARSLRKRAAEFEAAARSDAEPPSERTLRRGYRRLASLFDVELASFERKRYVNLSHAPNKAMNLNSYIGLMGRSLREVSRADGIHLEDCDSAHADLTVPNTDYIITLDADSLLLADYALKLMHVMEQPGNERVAVAQTPYSAIPGSPILLERVAGATTDLQHIIHQGATRFNGAYWVGANALLRKRALDDIREVSEERGFPIARYIQDRTVIEDTESTVDLIARGWTLYNYPERLAYSATPPDFGSLIIQRRRWANGGLLILPKLLRYMVTGPKRANRLAEGLLRVHYLTSLAVVSFGMLVLLAFPFEGAMRSLWLPLVAIPYFWINGRDLVMNGYGWIDLPRIYALNLLLIPINLGGVAKSLHQAVTGRNTPFGRTPKITGRTAAPRLYVAATIAILAYCACFGAVDLENSRWVHGGLMMVNAGLLWYAMCYMIGLREAAEDLGLLRAREAVRNALESMPLFNASFWRGPEVQELVGTNGVRMTVEMVSSRESVVQPLTPCSAEPLGGRVTGADVGAAAPTEIHPGT